MINQDWVKALVQNKDADSEKQLLALETLELRSQLSILAGCVSSLTDQVESLYRITRELQSETVNWWTRARTYR